MQKNGILGPRARAAVEFGQDDVIVSNGPGLMALTTMLESTSIRPSVWTRSKISRGAMALRMASVNFDLPVIIDFFPQQCREVEIV